MRMLFITCFISFSFCSCSDFLDIPAPKNQMDSRTAFTNDDVATSTVLGMYSEILRRPGFMSGDISSITMKAGLSADEFNSFNEDNNSFYLNNLSISNTEISNNIWGEAYKTIYYANSCLKGLLNADELTSGVKSRLLGEVYFIRAISYFYLVNMFGEVPEVIATDYLLNSTMARSPVEKIYDLILSDLKMAEELLPMEYVSFERVRPNKLTAKALLARVALYLGDWQAAIDYSSDVINSGLYSMVPVDVAFLSNSNEAIWQLKPVRPNRNTNEAFVFILRSDPTRLALSDTLVNSFDEGDKRFFSWVGQYQSTDRVYYYANKYKVRSGSIVTEYSVVFRLAEQYLIRAEAKYRSDNMFGALVDLDSVRSRAGLPLLSITTPELANEDLLIAIENERKIELFAEFGHRWLDLKRLPSLTSGYSSRADEVLSGVKGESWQDTDVYYPIPQSERANNKNLSQNLGY